MPISPRLRLVLPAVLLSGACIPFRHPSQEPTPAIQIQEASGAPTSFVRSTAESRTTRTLPVRDGLTRAQLWRTALDILNEKHTVEVRDQSAGYAMTGWEASATREGVPDLRYRTRVIIDFLGDDWKQVSVRAEAQWRASGEEWEVGYDAALLDEVSKDLRDRIGKPVSAR